MEPIIEEGIKKAIELSKECKPEDARIHPMVGAVIIKGDKIIQTAFRGEKKPGDHAEKTALVTKKGDLDFKDAILITTLEPCTGRSHPEDPCATLIVQAGIKEVWYGIIDPYPPIDGRGEVFLVGKGIDVRQFPGEYKDQVYEINKEYWDKVCKANYRTDLMVTKKIEPPISPFKILSPEPGQAFDDLWFKNHIQIAVKNAGLRYTPKINIELPIAQSFEGLGRTQGFYQRIKGFIPKLRKQCRYTTPKKSSTALFESTRNIIRLIIEMIRRIDEKTDAKIDWASIKSQIESAQKAISVYRESIEQSQSSSLVQQSSSESLYHLRQLSNQLSELGDFTESVEANLSNIPALLLVGEAGTGKTHLFCDIAEKRISQGLPTILLYGNQFQDNEPWAQILQLLNLQMNKEIFLGSLNNLARSKGKRALILIDALNEGLGKRLWDKYLAGILEQLQSYPWVGIAVSVRTTYEDLIIPHGLVPEKLIKLVHYGFRDREYQAAKTYFEHYKIEFHTIPLISPEFQNPLFLKLFCEGLHNRAMTRLPAGVQGLSMILDFFLDSVNEDLARPEQLDFNVKLHLIQEAVGLVADQMVDKESRYLPISGAEELINSLLPDRRHENSLYRSLISKGVLFEDRFPTSDGKWVDGVRFSYERFLDHLIVKRLLDKYLDPANPTKAFEVGGPLGSLVKDRISCNRNRGLIEALSIQLPERIQRELFELAPNCASEYPVRSGFIQSIIWRPPTAFRKAVLKYVNTTILPKSQREFWDTVLTVCTIPNHFFNADFIHRNLLRLPLAKRDAWWITYLHRELPNQGAITRLIDWASTPDDKSHIDPEAIRLSGVILAWFLSAANRGLRDNGSKALVNLLTPFISILRKVISQFLQVDDPYVLERLFAVAYGCAMRTTNVEELEGLARDIFAWIFAEGHSPPHLLLRDYARGVIELAFARGIKLNIDLSKIRPPYHSEWPSFTIPTIQELKPAPSKRKIMPSEEYAWESLYTSVMEPMGGDFAKYIIDNHVRRFKGVSVAEARRWILKKVLDLGWTVERFGEFDRTLQSLSSYNPQYYAERIGKKYQWIAYHECLARISDNYELKGDVYSDYETKYEGPWQFYARDIDPSCLLRKIECTWSDQHPNTWWFPVSYDAWGEELIDSEWLRRNDMPRIEPLLQVINPKDSSIWVVLVAAYNWDQPKYSEDNVLDFSRRRIWYNITSYLVKKPDIDEIFKAAFNLSELPDPPHMSNVFLGEFFWAPSYKYHTKPYFGYDGWTTIKAAEKHWEVHVTTEEYINEGGYDHSIDAAITIHFPVRLIVDNMELLWNGKDEGALYDRKGDLIAVDPSVNTKGPPAVLINRDAFLKFLDEKGYAIFWFVQGEKQIIGKRSPHLLEFRGIYKYLEDQIVGNFQFRYI